MTMRSCSLRRGIRQSSGCILSRRDRRDSRRCPALNRPLPPPACRSSEAREREPAFMFAALPVVPRSQMPGATIRVVTPGYFRTLGIPVLRGREFTKADDANPAPGFVVNDAFVKAAPGGTGPAARVAHGPHAGRKSVRADHRRGWRCQRAIGERAKRGRRSITAIGS